MKKNKKILFIVITTIICAIVLSFAFAFAFDLNIDLKDVYYKVGQAANKFNTTKSEKYNIDGEIVAYVNGFPITDKEIISRYEMNKNLKAAFNSELSWPENPVEFLYFEKFKLYYAEKNNITVSQQEIDEIVNYQKKINEEPEFKEVFENYLKGFGITKEKFYNELLPNSAKKKILNHKIMDHILTEANLNDLEIKEKEQYVNEFFRKNMKIEVKNPAFIKKYDKDTV